MQEGKSLQFELKCNVFANDVHLVQSIAEVYLVSYSVNILVGSSRMVNTISSCIQLCSFINRTYMFKTLPPEGDNAQEL